MDRANSSTTTPTAGCRGPIRHGDPFRLDRHTGIPDAQGIDDDPFVPLQALFHGPQAVVIQPEFHPAALEEAPIIDDPKKFLPLIDLQGTSRTRRPRALVTRRTRANSPGRRSPSGLGKTVR